MQTRDQGPRIDPKEQSLRFEAGQHLAGRNETQPRNAGDYASVRNLRDLASNKRENDYREQQVLEHNFSQVDPRLEGMKATITRMNGVDADGNTGKDRSVYVLEISGTPQYEEMDVKVSDTASRNVGEGKFIFTNQAGAEDYMVKLGSKIMQKFNAELGSKLSSNRDKKELDEVRAKLQAS